MPRILDRIRDVLAAVVGKERLASAGRSLKSLFKDVSRADALHAGALAVIVIAAALVRLLPIRWGFYLSEFDPYLQFRMTKFIVEHSNPTLLNGFAAWFSWHDYMSWYPSGLKMYLHFPGVAFTNAFIYSIVRAFGFDVTVFDVTVLFPVFAGALTTLAIYFLGKEVWGRGVGLLAALFMAFNSAHIGRTSLGFLRHETIGVLLIIAFFTFYLKASSPKRATRSTIIFSLLSGLTLGYLTASWAAALYPIAIVAVYSFVLLVLRRYSRNLLIAYVITYSINLVIAVGVPRLGLRFLTDFSTVIVLGVLVVLLANEAARDVKTTMNRLGLVGGVTVALALGVLILYQSGIVTLPAGKFISIINPAARLGSPIVESVAEHRPATWASFFHEFGAVVFLALFGIYQAFQRFRDSDIFLVLFALSSLYFSASFVRLTLILAPAFAVLAAIAVVRLARPAVDILKASGIVSARKLRRATAVGKELGLAILLILALVVTPTFYRAVNGAYSPPTIATSSIPTVPRGEDENKWQDWLEALMWVRDNTPKDAVVMAWWDYGYWITALADRRTLADNGTQNTTQIGVIATAFLANETRTLPIMKRYDVSYVAILAVWTKTERGQVAWSGVGEDGKWYWMARIGNGTVIDGERFVFRERRLGEEQLYTRTIVRGDKVVSNETISTREGLGDKTILGEMMQRPTNPEIKLKYFEPAFESSNKFVQVYKVYYPETTDLSISIKDYNIAFRQNAIIEGRLAGVKPQDMEQAAVIIETYSQAARRWEKISEVNPKSDGDFTYKWSPPEGTVTVRARFEGVAKKYLPAQSPEYQITVGKASVSLSCSPSKVTASLGEELTISCTISPVVTTGNVTLQFSLDGVKWQTIVTGLPISGDGKVSTTWRPNVEGVLQLRAQWGGASGYALTTVSLPPIAVRK